MKATSKMIQLTASVLEACKLEVDTSTILIATHKVTDMMRGAVSSLQSLLASAFADVMNENPKPFTCGMQTISLFSRVDWSEAGMVVSLQLHQGDDCDPDKPAPISSEDRKYALAKLDDLADRLASGSIIANDRNTNKLHEGCRLTVGTVNGGVTPSLGLFVPNDVLISVLCGMADREISARDGNNK